MKSGDETFESAIKDLEVAVARLESGDLPLEEALSCFENGVRAVGRCQELLSQAELRVEQLVSDAGGQTAIESFPRAGKEDGE